MLKTLKYLILNLFVIFSIVLSTGCSLFHTHEYGSMYDKNQIEHWKQCSCGEKINQNEHIYGIWENIIEPTIENTGSKKQVCNVCGFENVVEIPKLEINEYVVYFDSSGGSNISNVKVEHGKKIDEPISPIKEGYDFIGWYLDTKKWSFTDYVVTEDITLVAKWQAKNYTLCLVNEDVETNYNIFYNEEFILPNSTKKGYIFEGWFDINGNQYFSGIYSFANNITLIAKYRPYRIYFDTLGGEKFSYYESSDNKILNLPTPQKENCVFEGWYNGDELVSSPFEYDSDITLVAKWGSANEEFEYQILDQTSIKIVKYIGDKENVVIPNVIDGLNVTSISKNVFSNSNILSVVFASSLIEIEKGILNGCNMIESIQISDNIPITLKELFGVSSSIEVPKSLVTIKYNNGSSIINNEFFDILEGRTFKIVLARDLKEIQKDNINACPFVSEIDIPNGITISLDSFVGCSNLLIINYPTDSNFIGEINYANCQKITKVFIPEDIKEISLNSFRGCSNITELNFPEGVIITGELNFSGWEKIEKIDFSKVIFKGSTTIGKYAFSGCTNLKYINLPDNITYIFDHSFLNCSSLVEIVIPNSVTSIGYNSFQGCTSLKKVVLPEKLSGIDYYLFSGCTNLETIILPKEFKYINPYAFLGCSSLKNIILPEGVLEIRDGAFQSCSSLEFIVLPFGIDKINESAFSGCKNIVVFSYEKERPNNWSNNALKNLSIYWLGEWEFNDYGIPVIIENKD